MSVLVDVKLRWWTMHRQRNEKVDRHVVWINALPGMGLLHTPLHCIILTQMVPAHGGMKHVVTDKWFFNSLQQEQFLGIEVEFTFVSFQSLTQTTSTDEHKFRVLDKAKQKQFGFKLTDSLQRNKGMVSRHHRHHRHRLTRLKYQ